jgi:DNA-binding LytR/AlgR family response regulator
MQPPEFFFVRENRSYVKVWTASIAYLESRKNYVKIVTATGSHLVNATLNQFEKLLDGGNFHRIHRGFLINIMHISTFDRKAVMILGNAIPVGETNYHSLERLVVVIGGQEKQHVRKPAERPVPNILV